MEEKKNNKGLIWLIVILIVLVLGLVGYIVCDNVLKDNNELSNNSNITSTTTTVNNNEYLIKETKLSESGKKIILEQKTLDSQCILSIDKKDIIINDMISPDYSLKLHKNFIELWFYDPVGSKDNFYIYDYQGNLLIDEKKLNVVDKEYLNNTNNFYYHYYYISSSEFNISDNKIEYSIGYYNDTCVLGLVESCAPNELTIEDLKQLGENIKYRSKYEIELIDNSFSSPELISEIKFNETDYYKKAYSTFE